MAFWILAVEGIHPYRVDYELTAIGLWSLAIYLIIRVVWKWLRNR
jgi:hypothetical protein